MHPLLGDLDAETGEPSGTIEREVDLAEPIETTSMIELAKAVIPRERFEKPPPQSRAAPAAPETTPKSYCESCGGVDQHMPGCPTLRPPPEERFVDFTSPKVSPLRTRAAKLLRRLAELLDG